MTVSYMKRGAAAAGEMKKAEEKSQQQGLDAVYRFWMPNDTEKTISFLDGDLVDDGVLECPVYYEHQIFMNDNWRNWFICTSEQEPCPICEGGDNSSRFGALTIMDQTGYVGKKGNHHKDLKRLFVAKRQSLKQLQMMATKRGGLRGCMFDVARTGENSAAVGNIFDFTEKLSVGKLKKLYKDLDVEPYDYEKEIPFIPAKKLRKMGFGSMVVGTEDDDEESEGYEKEL